MSEQPSSTEEQGHGHGHGHGHDDHDHDHGISLTAADDEHAFWAIDHIALVAVGIDIGSATSHFVLSRIELRREGRELSGKFQVVSRDILYRSPVHLTPYLSKEQIDADAVMRMLADAYHQAGIRPEDVNVGAVILTGEAVRRLNARAITDALAAAGGDFVCATAGHHLEAVMAAYGSGTIAVSRERGGRVLNVDIGGGTTKFAVVEDGRLTQTAALEVGARLIAVDEAGTIIRLEDAGRRLAEACGFDWNVGDQVTTEQLDVVGVNAVRSILAAVRQEEMPAEVPWLTDPLRLSGDLVGITFSGGVSEYVYQRTDVSYGDLGRSIGAALRESADSLPAPVIEVAGGILATVLGASQYTVQVSGNTVFVSDPARLPVRDLQVVPLVLTIGEEVSRQQIRDEVEAQLRALDLLDLAELGALSKIALALDWTGNPSFSRVNAVTSGIRDALTPIVSSETAICIVLSTDLAHLVGSAFAAGWDVGSLVVCIDGIEVREFDYIDIGRQLEPSKTIPVTIKSLIFEGEQELDGALVAAGDAR